MSDIQSIFDNQHINGGPYWSREDGNIYAPNGSSTLDTLIVLGENGFTIQNNEIVAKAVDFVLTYQHPDGSFKYAPKSPKLPCLAARIMAALIRLGVPATKIKKSYQWLINSQKEDGGWRCNTVKLGKSPITDASNPGTTLYVLDAFRSRKNTQNELKQLNRGTDFLLQHWEVRQPIGPCNFGIGSRFMQIEYPLFRYNMFYYVYVLSFYDNAKKDGRFLEAFNQLENKVQDNKLIPEKPHRAWQEFDFAKKGKVSAPATEKWLEIKRNLDIK